MCDGTTTTTTTTTTGGYGSTSNGGSSSNGKATNGDIEKAPLLISRENTPPDSIDGNGNGNNKGNTNRVLIGVAIIVVIVIGSSIIHSRDDKNDNSNSGISWDNDVFNDDDRDNDNTDPDPSSTSSSSTSSDSSSSPFLLDPINDMGMLSVKRNMDASPSIVWGKHLHKKNHPLPTNSWYLNLVSQKAAYKPDDSTRVYTTPYIIDTSSPIKDMEGIRVHWPILQASDNNMQMVNNYRNGLCLGGIGDFIPIDDSIDSEGEGDGEGSGNSGTYNVIDSDKLSPLGIGLEWNKGEMVTNIIRGMPYATMEYNINTSLPSSSSSSSSSSITPTIYSYNGLSSDVKIDSTSSSSSSSSSATLKCGIEGGVKGNTVVVKSHLHLHLINSDFTWMVFFNRPVTVACTTNKEKLDVLKDFKLSIIDVNDDDIAIDNDDESTSESEAESSSDTNTTTNINDKLVIRVAMLNQCTTGKSTMMQHCMEKNMLIDPEGYEKLLIKHSHIIPKNPSIHFDYRNNSTATATGSSSSKSNTATINIDWDATSTKKITSGGNDDDDSELLMFALPHHQTSLLSMNTSSSSSADHCVHTFHGSTCLIQNSKWSLNENVGSPLSFVAPRPPSSKLIPYIAKYLATDIKYQMSNNILRGAADTYFSGKTIARLARIIIIADELQKLQDADTPSSKSLECLYYGDNTVDKIDIQESITAVSKVKLPSTKDTDLALEQLKIGVTTWLKSNAEAPYIYDTTWGGMVNCGCIYVGKGPNGHCNNTFPDCPALLSVNEDFGNGYYNDHHYHYGYHVYAAAVAAKLDPEWGRKHFDEVLLYIRDFANPLEDDEYFPQYRQKDWFLGSSWASGIVSAENSPHGRNEESSSEAISAYEGVTLFGAAMVDAFNEEEHVNKKKLETAKLIRDSGQLLTATEISATNRYWHVWSSDTHNNTYPKEYAQPVVGMLYDTMASFQTWFSSWPVVSMGIQLIPLTPVAETRDDIEWATQVYPKYEKACKIAGDFCIDNGWSILQAGLLATSAANNTGGSSDTTDTHSAALKQALSIPKEVFATDGGVGNSMSNTIWYIATRKKATTD